MILYVNERIASHHPRGIELVHFCVSVRVLHVFLDDRHKVLGLFALINRARVEVLFTPVTFVFAIFTRFSFDSLLLARFDSVCCSS